MYKQLRMYTCRTRLYNVQNDTKSIITFKWIEDFKEKINCELRMIIRHNSTQLYKNDFWVK